MTTATFIIAIAAIVLVWVAVASAPVAQQLGWDD
jgi:hypothetical protein